MTTTFSSREFNQHASKAKHAALSGPVVITDRGQPSHVLLTYAMYQQMTEQQENIVDLLAMPKLDDIDDNVFRISGNLYRAEDLS